MNKVPYERLLMLYVPWGLSLLFQSDPPLSYMIAWLGSFYIFFITITGWVKPLPDDRSLTEQVMRPILLVQIIFAGYMSLTSIFYFLSVLGYDNFEKTSSYFLVDTDKLAIVAQCQRYYCLGHAAFVTGILMFMQYPIKHKFKVQTESIAKLLLIAAVVSLPVSILFLKVQGLYQFYNQLSTLSFMSGTLALAFAIPEKKPINIVICSILYISNFYAALTSGFKEPIIISVMVLGVFLYPNYKKAVLVTFLPALLMLFILLPTYASVFRANAWSGDVDVDEASQLAVDAALNQDDHEGTNWDFFVNRLSEIDMFTYFVRSTPDKIDFYHFDLIKQSAIAVIPRIFWPSKPNTEEMVMDRVYLSGAVNRGSVVSAKPAYIVDAYLSDGTLGVFLALFIYGAAAQIISQKAEYLFGGYLLGTALIFSGLFQIFWRGLSFEFLLNSVFWSYITMLILHSVLKTYKVIEQV